MEDHKENALRLVGSFKALVETLHQLLTSQSKTVGYIACCMRNEQTFDAFLELLKERGLEFRSTSLSGLHRTRHTWSVLEEFEPNLLILTVQASDLV